MSKNQKKIIVFGYFGHETNHIDGQSIKTRQIYLALKTELSSDYVSHFDTERISLNKLSLVSFLKKITTCDFLYYLPGQSNLKYLFPILFLLSYLFKFKIIYVVVGGWLASFLEHHKFHRILLSKITSILVESTKMKQELENIGLHECDIQTLHNFRIHDYTAKIDKYDGVHLKLVFMARIVEEKGVFRIIDTFERSFLNSNNVSIDFYGALFEKDKEIFLKKIQNLNNVNYNGKVNHSDVYSVLNKYDALLLPTNYSGEGFPGTIIDSYIAGIPVVISNWRLLPSFVDHYKTGLIINLEEELSLDKAIKELQENQNLTNSMKTNALEKSKEYSYENSKDTLFKYVT